MRRSSYGLWAAFLALITSTLLVGCRLPTRTDWSRCTPQDNACLPGYLCDTTVWLCVSHTPEDGGVMDGPAEAKPVDAVEAGPALCTSNTACTESGKPVCNVSTGSCVGCRVSATDCGGASPVCDLKTKSCVGCVSGTDCQTEAPVCLVGAQTCVECAADGDCAGAKPICDTAAHRCVACATDFQCLAKETAKGACSGSGACVACVDSKIHCPVSTSPICDPSAASCRGCRNNAECASTYGADPGLCVAGACVKDNAVIYVRNDSPRCTGSTVGEGISAAPYCVPADAVAHLTPSRRILLLRGPEPLRSFSLGPSGDPVMIAGQNDAQVSVLSGTDTALVTVTAGDVTLRDLTIRGGTSGVGVSATGGTLRLRRCQVLDNPEGGLSVKNAGFDIASSLFAGNGKSGANAVVLGAAPAAAPTLFAFNTVVDNAGIGVFCSQPYVMSSVISSANALAFSKDCMATDVCATTCSSSPLLASARPYALTEASAACIDVVASETPPADDLLGLARPVGRASDCGALEYRPPPSTTDASVTESDGATDSPLMSVDGGAADAAGP